MPGQVFFAQVITVLLKERKLMDIPKLGTLRKEPSEDIIFYSLFLYYVQLLDHFWKKFYAHDSQDCFVRLYYSQVLFA